jgi:signal transduction histidine kinase
MTPRRARTLAGGSFAVLEVQLAEREGRLEFGIRDDGSGFDPATTPRGSGLQNMADRLEALGGSLEIRSAPRSGTAVTGRVPITAEATR